MSCSAPTQPVPPPCLPVDAVCCKTSQPLTISAQGAMSTSKSKGIQLPIQYNRLCRLWPGFNSSVPLKISPESPEGLVCKPVFCSSVAAPPLARSRPELESYSRQAALLPSGQKVCKRQWRQLRDYWGNSGQSTSTCKDEHKVYSPSGEARS